MCFSYLNGLFQALTKLDLSYTGTGDQGAKYLGDALKYNTVRDCLVMYLS